MIISKDQTKDIDLDQLTVVPRRCSKIEYYLMRSIAMGIAIKLITRNVMVFRGEMVRDDYDIEDLY